MTGQPHILEKLWETMGRLSFWTELGERLLLLLALFIAAKVFLVLTRRLIALGLRGRPRTQRVTTLGAVVQSLIRYATIFVGLGDKVVIYPNQLRGEVVEMGARMVKLRGAEGELHQIAYSSIQSVTNLTRQADR